MDRNIENGKVVGKGLIELNFSFLCNGGASPAMSSLRGADVTWVDSLVRTGAGLIVVTLTLGARCRYVAFKDVQLDDLDAADDGSYANAGPVNNEGSSTVKQNFKVYTRVIAGTKTDFTGRRLHVRMLLKNSTVGV